MVGACGKVTGWQLVLARLMAYISPIYLDTPNALGDCSYVTRTVSFPGFEYYAFYYIRGYNVSSLGGEDRHCWCSFSILVVEFLFLNTLLLSRNFLVSGFACTQ